MSVQSAPAPMDGSGRDHAWFDGGAGSKLDRHPLFGDAMDRTARALAENLSALSASPIEVSFKGVEAGMVDGLLERHGNSSALLILQAPAWHTAVALQFGQAFVSTAVEALFGGAGDDPDTGQRDFPSPVDTRIAAAVADQIVEALTTGFAEILPTAFLPEPMRPKPDPQALGKPMSPVLIATLLVRTLDRSVELDVIIPQAALNGFGDRLASTLVKRATTPDPRWTRQLEAEVGRAAMRLEASLDLPPMSLGEIAALRPGQVLSFALAAGDNVKLSCAGGDLFRCALGQSSGRYTLRVDEPIAPASPSPRKDH